MPREMAESYIWAALQGPADNGLVEDVTPWPEGDDISEADVQAAVQAQLADLESRIDVLEGKKKEKVKR